MAIQRTQGHEGTPSRVGEEQQDPMVKCERCGTAFGPIQAAVLEFCPRCKARDQVNTPLIVARVEEKSAPKEKAS